MSAEPGPLLPSDEYLNHQIVDTFARVAQTDRAWTEKVCAMAAATDGSVQLALGLGKYVNRNVMDGWAGISRGKEQWTVRASRELRPDPETTTIGPIRYEVVETTPRPRIRFALDANDAQPIAFEWIAESELPPFLEDHEVHVSRDGFRLDADVLRFHQSGTATGWYEIDGRRTEFTRDWVACRDRSWGVRYQVGAPVADIAPGGIPEGVSIYALWFPASCRRPDGTPYGLHFYFQRYAAFGLERRRFEGGIEHADGRRERFVEGGPDLRYDDRTRRILGGTFTTLDAEGRERVYTFTPVSDTGFHLAPALYGGYEGRYHGQWHGALTVDGEHFADCTDEAVLGRVRHHRQALVRVEDPDGGVGYGDCQTLVGGVHPEIGLTEAGVAP